MQVSSGFHLQNAEKSHKSEFRGNSSILSYYIVNMLGAILGFTAGMMMFVLISEMIIDALEENKILGMLGILFGFTLMMMLEKIL